jgi:hypothetical protein
LHVPDLPARRDRAPAGGAAAEGVTRAGVSPLTSPACNNSPPPPGRRARRRGWCCGIRRP